MPASVFIFLVYYFNLRVIREDKASQLDIVKSIDKFGRIILGSNVSIVF